MASDSYAVPPELLKEFTPQEVEEFKSHFKAFDTDGNGSIDDGELKTILHTLGEAVEDDEVRRMIAEVDLDRSGTVDFGEFLAMMNNMRGGKETAFAKVYTKSAALFEVKGAGGGSHSFSEEERSAFSEHINQCLGSDPVLADRLPLDPDSMDLFGAVRDGILLTKLINCAVEDTVDVRALNVKKPGKELNIYEITENQNLCINAAKAIGCTVVNIGPTDLIEGTPHLILGLIWQIVKVQLLNAINLKNFPELVRLLEDGEELSDLLRLSPDQILLRWLNFHLREAGHPRRAHNFGKDLKDSEIYTVVLAQIAPAVCDTAALAESDLGVRAEHVIRNSKALEVPTFIKSTDIVAGNKRLNLAHCAQIFNTCHGLSITEEELYEMAGFLDDDEGDSREERTFRMWINSLNIPDVYVHNLFEDVRDGLVLLSVMDKVEPGIVSWRRVNRNPKNKFKKVENCNYCVVLAKQLRFSMINIGGLDFVDGNKKLILGLTWQLMRYHTIKILSALHFDGRPATDADIVEWANGKVSAKGRPSVMSSFRDPTLATGLFLMDLLYAVEPRAINWDLVTEGADDEGQKNNARYVISVARKIGACVFLTWEDIVEVKAKMLMTFIASVMLLDTGGK
eukprot:PLAT7369.1.p1 GENE.PLAT7369.1~~PLAT7369.1.p1  ORF type:complete len:625 (+),score=349.20 PLAT7369.1:83-1957(+)